jgi:DNA-binding MarR family transcriptional regulator
MSEARQMQITSLDSFKALAASLGARQQAVYYCLKTNGPMSNREIAKELHWPINSVTGRVMELRKHQLVRFLAFKHDFVTNRNVIVWEAK